MILIKSNNAGVYTSKLLDELSICFAFRQDLPFRENVMSISIVLVRTQEAVKYPACPSRSMIIRAYP